MRVSDNGPSGARIVNELGGPAESIQAPSAAAPLQGLAQGDQEPSAGARPVDSAFIDSFESFHTPAASSSPVARASWNSLEVPWRFVKKATGAARDSAAQLINSTNARLQEATAARYLAGQLDFIVSQFPRSENIAAFYCCTGDVTELRAALKAAKPTDLRMFSDVLAEIVRDQVVNRDVITHLRVWFDALVGPCNSAREARKRCLKVFLTQHPDKVGERDFGSQLYNRDAKMMYDLLNLSKKALGEESLATKLYPQGKPPGHRGHCAPVFFWPAAGAGALAVYVHLSKSSSGS